MVLRTAIPAHGRADRETAEVDAMAIAVAHLLFLRDFGDPHVGVLALGDERQFAHRIRVGGLRLLQVELQKFPVDTAADVEREHILPGRIHSGFGHAHGLPGRLGRGRLLRFEFDQVHGALVHLRLDVVQVVRHGAAIDLRYDLSFTDLGPGFNQVLAAPSCCPNRAPALGATESWRIPSRWWSRSTARSATECLARRGPCGPWRRHRVWPAARCNSARRRRREGPLPARRSASGRLLFAAVPGAARVFRVRVKVEEVQDQEEQTLWWRLI